MSDKKTNWLVAVYTNKIILVPYCQHHVEKYHGWMQDAELQAATASEPLTLQAEYGMQRSWRQDSDKLTFISCVPPKSDRNAERKDDEMGIGDVNLFIIVAEGDAGELSLVGEIEIMVADKQYQGMGMGRAALLAFMKYILRHQSEILQEYFSTPREIESRPALDHFQVKIGETNHRSLHLFESIGFRRINPAPNFFGEWELRMEVTPDDVEAQTLQAGIEQYEEVLYST